MDNKKCNKCDLFKNIFDFKIINYEKTKFEDVCMECSDELLECVNCNKQMKLNNFRLINKYNKKYCENCLTCEKNLKEEKIKKQKEQKKIKDSERMKKLYIKKKDYILERNKKWRDNNKEYRSIKDKEYRNKPEIKEHIQEYNLKNKERRKEYSKKYIEEHKNNKKEYDKQYRIDNIEKIKERNEVNKDINKERRKKYYEKNKDEINQKKRASKNPNNPVYLNYLNSLKTVLQRKLGCKKRHNKYKVTISLEQLTELWSKQDGKCYITGVKMATQTIPRTLINVSIDQIKAGEGYIPENIGLCCESINLSKMQMKKEEFIEQLKLAGKNIKEKFYEKNKENVNNEISDDCKKYLLTLFDNKKLKNKLGVDNIINLWKNQNGKCALTGIDMTFEINTDIKYRNPTNISVDKIDPKLGYTLNNIHLTCLWANTGKLFYSVDEYRNLLLEAYENISK